MKTTPAESGILHTTDKDGRAHDFPYTCEKDTHEGDRPYERRIKWSFIILVENDVFQFDVVDEQTRMRVELMDRNRCERYKAKGIPEAFIRLSHKIFELPVVSSKYEVKQSAFDPRLSESAEKRSPDANRVWERLVSSGEASFDDDESRYRFDGGTRLHA